MRRRSLLALAVLATLSPLSQAGGPLRIQGDGTPVIWNLDETILDASGPGLVPYRVDLGGLGTLSGDETTAFADRIFSQYDSIPTSRVALENVGPILSPSPVLTPGTYHIAVANASVQEATFALMATVVLGDGGGTSAPMGDETVRLADPTLIPLTSGVSIWGQTIAGGGGDLFVQLDPQYTIEVPVGAVSLDVIVSSGDGDIDLFLRHGLPVAEDEDGALLFDHGSQGSGTAENIVLYPEQIPVDVTPAQVGWHISPSPTGQNEIIYDENGTIHTALFGQSTGVLGFFSNRAPDERGFFTEGYVVLNGSFIDGVAPDLPVASFRGVFTHEFGHFIGLDHSQINGETAANASGALVLPDFSDGQQWDLFVPFLETLFPFIFGYYPLDSELAKQNLTTSGFFTNDLALDEQIITSTLYPEPGFLTGPGSSTGAIEGRVLRGDGITPFSGANVVMRRVEGPLGSSPYPPPLGTESYPGFEVELDEDGVPAAPPVQAGTDSLATAASMVSGAWGPGAAPPGEPVTGSGWFRIEGLPPGIYEVSVETILSSAVGGSRIGPFNPQLVLPSEESWSGVGESSLEQEVLPLQVGISDGGFEEEGLTPYMSEIAEGDVAAPLEVEAGQVQGGIDLLLETPSPEGNVHRLGALGTTAPIQPPEGSAQLLLTTVEGFAGSIAQRFVPLADDRAISFQINFLTNEETPDAVFNDRAILTVERPSGQIDAVVLADTFDEFTEVNSSTGFGEATGFRTVTLGDLDLLPPGEELTLRWSAVDGWDAAIDTALLLDDIRTLPDEPAEVFASVLPGLMSFGGWSAVFSDVFTPALTEGSDRGQLILGSPAGPLDVHGVWISPPDTLPWQPGSVYRIRFHLRSDQSDPSNNPLVRLRVFTANGKAWLENRLESTGGSVVSPTPDGAVAEVWFDPPDLSADQGDEAPDDLLIAFEVDDFDDRDQGRITLEGIEVDRFAADDLMALATTRRTWTTFDEGDIEETGSIPAAGILVPDIDRESDHVSFATEVSHPDGSLGYYGEVFTSSAVDVTPGQLVRAVFNLSTEGDARDLTRLRPRLIFGDDLQLSTAVDLFPLALGADPTGNAPAPLGEGGRDYTLLLRVPEGLGPSPEIRWAMGVIDFESDRGGTFALNRVDIQTLDPSLLPDP
ncbi:hypothetical protein JXA47_14195 [Candidatus Sumerlaeota bacterium]|nr:hypothetical protein [Candidatus Sumerlaeota bacterium]